MSLPTPIQNLIEAFSRLPGVGPKTASRLTFYLLRSPENFSLDLAQALDELKSGTAFCQTCFNITDAGRVECRICTSDERDHGTLCVVEEPLDVLAIEKTGGYQGVFHVLHGALSPIEGISPEDLKIRELMSRLQSSDVREIILATNPSMEGDATAMYLRNQLENLDVQITRLARGLPMGGDLEYADQNTILRALAGRQRMD
ncbi:MAG: recombination protein RecR [Anaerolineales bacterium]|nr:recombination protein RecR [Chloroflexota bacterium]MBL6980393.1 recombination protein RecR [Anaerolineales bacterium]